MMQKASEVIKKLQGKTLVTAESLTGGMIGAELTAVPGASAVYKGGVVSYTNEVKQAVLGVPEEILDRYGAVSMWTAGYMASGARKLLNADVAVSVTGLAGPGGGTEDIPVGRVYLGLSREEGTETVTLDLQGDREQVRSTAVLCMIQEIIKRLTYTKGEI